MISLIRRWQIAVVFATVALLAAPARADDAHAKELFKQGSVFFDLSQYDKAIDVWQRGYEEKQDPGFLYNIAQAYRLWGNPEKAVTFYKSFLRNAPKAPNRAEIDEKIATLQRQLADAQVGRAPGGVDGSPAAAPPAYPSAPVGTPAASPGAESPPAALAPPAASEPAVAAIAAATPAETAPPARRIDLGVAAGGTFWLTGVQGAADSSFAVVVRGGISLASDPAAPVAFRLGAAVGYTFLGDIDGRTSFISILAEPGAQVRLVGDQWFLHAGLGIGVLLVAGLKPTSALLSDDGPLAVEGTQSMLELRPRVDVEYRLSPSLALSVGPSLAYSPKRTYYTDQLLRLQVLAAFTFRI